MLYSIRRLVYVLLIGIPLVVATAQEPPRAQIGVFACEQQPQTKRSAVLAFRSGARAYIEATVRVAATGRDELSGEQTHKCHADWTLHIAAPAQEQFQPAPAFSFTEREFEAGYSTDGSTYYGGSVLGWSPDGDLLLAYAQIGAYEDWFLPIPLVYSMSENKVWAVDLRPLFAPRTKKGCDLHFNPLGFSPDGRVVFEAEPFDYADQNCFRQSRWLLDFRREKLSPASPALKPQLGTGILVGKND